MCVSLAARVQMFLEIFLPSILDHVFLTERVPIFVIDYCCWAFGCSFALYTVQ